MSATLGVTNAAWEHLWSPSRAFDHPVTVLVVALVAAALAAAWVMPLALGGKMSEKTRADVRVRTRTWTIIAPLMIAPVLLGAGPMTLMMTLAAAMCYREFARATGLFRERVTSACVAVGIVLTGFCALDNWWGLFVALPAWFTVGLFAANVVGDRPKGYLQRTALASIGFLLFGVGLGHLSFMANASPSIGAAFDYRPMVCVLIFCLQFNDIAAYVTGKSLGRRKVFPNTSPNKTLAGHVGALVLTTPLAAALLRWAFDGSVLGEWRHCVVIGLIIAVAGQLGDLVLGSIKRDLDLKDLSNLLPGHGGVSDRFNNALLAAPAVFHYVNYAAHIVPSEPGRIITGG